MLRTCSPPYPSCCCPVPNQFDFHRPLRKRRKPISICFSNNWSHSTHISALAFTPPITVTELHEKNYSKDDNCSPDPDPSLFRRFYYIFYSNDATNENPESQDQEQEQEQEQEEEQRGRKTKKAKGLFTNMWWANLRAALGQRFNLEGIVSSAMVVLKDQHLALPHVSVPDIRSVDWVELHRRGFKGVVFDKDNTITAPYSLKIWGPLCSSLQQCKTIFGPNIAVFSNSAGLCEYDVDGSKARALEGAVGIRVIRHRVKKPAGTAEEIEKHFGCKSSQLIMVGDRPFTDIVFGNRNGFLTILTEPLSLAEEPFIVTQVRKLERFLVDRWFRKGLKPTSHRLLSDESFCIKDPSTS